jgi:hypothetical protein
VSTGNININNPRQHRMPVSTALAPDLAAGADTCLGSISGAAQHSVFGLSLGKTVRDKNCERIRNAKLYAATGDLVSMYATQCGDPEQRSALALAGIQCTAEQFAKMRADAEYRANKVAAAPATSAPTVLTLRFEHTLAAPTVSPPSVPLPKQGAVNDTTRPARSAVFSSCGKRKAKPKPACKG